MNKYIYVVFSKFHLSCAYLNTGFHFAIIIFILSLYSTTHNSHPRNNTGTVIVMYEFRCIYLIFLPTQCIFKVPHDLESTNFNVFVVIQIHYITINGFRGPGTSIGIANGYGLDGPGIESRWGSRFSAPVQTGPGAHPAFCTMGTGSFPG